MKISKLLSSAAAVITALTSLAGFTANGEGALSVESELSDGAFAYEVVDGSYTIVKCTATIVTSVPAIRNGVSITAIGDNAFAFCIRIQGIELPTTMFFIGDRAFFHCTDLRVIQMPKTLTTIGESAFEGCTSLIDVVMPNSVIEMGANVFKDCDNVRHFVISQGLTEIPEGAFMNCKSVTDYFIPASVTALGCNAFDGYVNLKTVTFFGNIPPEPECEPAFGREIPIYVKSQAFDQYKASYHWGQYAIKAM